MKVAEKLKEIREIVKTWEAFMTNTYANGKCISHDSYGDAMDDVAKIKGLTYEISSELKQNNNQITFIDFSKHKETSDDN